MSARSYLDDVEEQIVQARRLLGGMQHEFAPGPSAGAGRKVMIDADALWHSLRRIDDKLHDALGKLGD